MIRLADGRTVAQASHAWISGQLARAWDAPFEPYEAVCLAAEQHDVGMAEYDLDPDTDFLNMPIEVHGPLWVAAPRRMLAQSTYAAMLVAMHGVALYRRRTDPVGRATHDELAAQRDAWMAELGEDPERASRNQRLVWAWDFLSLAMLVPGWAPGEVDTPTHGTLAIAPAAGGAFSVDPWPFAGSRLDVVCEARRGGAPEPLELSLLAPQLGA